MGYLLTTITMTTTPALFTKGQTVYDVVDGNVIPVTIRGYYYHKGYKCYVYFVNEFGNSYKESQLLTHKPDGSK